MYSLNKPENTTNKFAGLYVGQVLVTLVVSALTMWFVSPLVGMIACCVACTGFHLWNRRQERPESAWEISERGTHQLWNDGPKHPVPLNAQSRARLNAIYGGMSAADVKKMMAGAKVLHVPKD